MCWETKRNIELLTEFAQSYLPVTINIELYRSSCNHYVWLVTPNRVGGTMGNRCESCRLSQQPARSLRYDFRLKAGLRTAPKCVAGTRKDS